MEKLRDDLDKVMVAYDDSGDDMQMTERYQTIPRAPRSVAVPIADTRTTHSTPDATSTVPPPVSTPPAQ